MTKIVYLSTVNILLSMLVVSLSLVNNPTTNNPTTPQTSVSLKDPYPPTLKPYDLYGNKSFYIEYGPDIPTKIGSYLNHYQSVVYKEGDAKKIIYSIPAEYLEWGNHISSLTASRDGKYVHVVETGYEWQIHHLFSVESGKDLLHQTELEGQVTFVDDKFFVFNTYSNEFAGTSITGIFVSDYENRDNFKPLKTIDSFGSEITIINASDPLVTFVSKEYPCDIPNARCEPLFTLYQYNALTEKLIEL